eukprot:Opistho-1_new@86977
MGAADKRNHGSLAFKKKEYYVFLSFTFSLFLTAMVITDYAVISLHDDPQTPTETWVNSLLVMHLASFYGFLMSYIYCTESGNARLWQISVVTGVLSLAAFIARVIFELMYDMYRPEVYVGE